MQLGGVAGRNPFATEEKLSAAEYSAKHRGVRQRLERGAIQRRPRRQPLRRRVPFHLERTAVHWRCGRRALRHGVHRRLERGAIQRHPGRQPLHHGVPCRLSRPVLQRRCGPKVLRSHRTPPQPRHVEVRRSPDGLGSIMLRRGRTMSWSAAAPAASAASYPATAPTASTAPRPAAGTVALQSAAVGPPRPYPAAGPTPTASTACGLGRVAFRRGPDLLHGAVPRRGPGGLDRSTPHRGLGRVAVGRDPDGLDDAVPRRGPPSPACDFGGVALAPSRRRVRRRSRRSANGSDRRPEDREATRERLLGPRPRRAAGAPAYPRVPAAWLLLLRRSSRPVPTPAAPAPAAPATTTASTRTASRMTSTTTAGAKGKATAMAATETAAGPLKQSPPLHRRYTSACRTSPCLRNELTFPEHSRAHSSSPAWTVANASSPARTLAQPAASDASTRFS